MDMDSATNTERRPSLGDAMLKGAVAGAIGAVAMMAAWKLEKETILPPDNLEEPPSEKIVDNLADRAGVHLSDAESLTAGVGLNLVASALVGALYGAAESRADVSPVLGGLALGGAVFALCYPSWGLLPQLGIQQPIFQSSLEATAVPIGANAVFGLTTALAFDALAGRRDHHALRWPAVEELAKPTEYVGFSDSFVGARKQKEEPPYSQTEYPARAVGRITLDDDRVSREQPPPPSAVTEAPGV